MRVSTALAALAVMPGLVAMSASAEMVVPVAAQTGLALALYQQGLAVVRDERRATLATGLNRLAVEGVSHALQPQTVMVALPAEAEAVLVAQNLEADLLSPEALLEKSVGAQVRVVLRDPATGAERLEAGRLLSAHGREGLVAYAGGVRAFALDRLVLPEVPDSLRQRPTLVLAIEAQRPAEGTLAITYQTDGLGWQADHVAMLGADDATMSLRSSVSIANETGVPMEDARVRLVAGVVALQPGQPVPKAQLQRMEAVMASDAAPVPQAVADLHVYTLEQPVTLMPRQTRRMTLASADRVTVEKEYRLEGGSYIYQRLQPGSEMLRPLVRYRLTNSADSGLGRPLPAGVVRVYREEEGLPIFVGEDRLEHLPVGETAWLATGRAFDVTAERRQTAFDREGMARGVQESAYEIVLRNAGAVPVVVQVAESIPGDWQMLQESQPHTREAANLAIWSVSVPAAGTATLRYRVRVRF